MNYETFEVPVSGGRLSVGRWGSGSKLVLAAHGLTGNHHSFGGMAAELGSDFSVVAPDLRGRGRSAGVGGPYGIDVHADDLMAVLDQLEIGTAVLAGHSMGGFVIISAAVRHPERVTNLVLIDGGIPLDMKAPAGLSVEEIIRLVVGPALDRLDVRFPSADAYLDFWRQHPAIGPYWNQTAEETYLYDLVGDAPNLRSSVVKEAVLGDGSSQMDGGESSLSNAKQPITFLWAERGMLDETPGLYPPEVVESWTKRVRQLRAVAIEDVNHYTILLSDHGAKAVASAVEEATKGL